MADTSASIKISAFLASTAGRWARIGLGAVLVVVGVLTGGIGGIIVALIGLVPVGLGMSNRCLIAKALGGPWKGEEAIEMAK